MATSISHQDRGSGVTTAMQNRQDGYKENTAVADRGGVTSDGGNNTKNVPSVESSTASAEREVHEERISLTRDAASRLESILNDTKETTNRLLREIDVYAQTVEDVTIDLLRVQDSQHKETQRLEEVEPDVAGATSHFPMNATAIMMQSTTSLVGDMDVGASD